MKSSSTCNRNRLNEFPVDIENLFEHFFGNANQPTSQRLVPPTNITESETRYTLMVELPGVAVDQVSIEMQDGQLEISGTKTVAETGDGQRFVKSERQAGEFRRQFDFASQVDADKISAQFTNGLLTIVLPKSEQVLPRKIQIQSIEN